MKVIILAAGKGERLLPLTRNTPKSLLELGNGMTVLENQLDVIGSSGIKHVVIVTGYKSEQIEAKVKDFSNFHISIVYNPFFDVSNNLVSAWMARGEMKEDFIIVNGDVIYNSNITNALLKNNNDICVVISKKNSYDQEDMKVITDETFIHRMGKDIPVEESNGESIGMIKFQRKGKAIIAEVLDSAVKNKAYLTAFFPAALQLIIDKGFPVHYMVSSSEDSAEIDFHPDLNEVKSSLDKYCRKIDNWKKT
jgi:L-glutamine-phosphate cytidylyltransferase